MSSRQGKVDSTPPDRNMHCSPLVTPLRSSAGSSNRGPKAYAGLQRKDGNNVVRTARAKCVPKLMSSSEAICDYVVRHNLMGLRAAGRDRGDAAGFSRFQGSRSSKRPKCLTFRT